MNLATHPNMRPQLVVIAYWLVERFSSVIADRFHSEVGGVLVSDSTQFVCCLLCAACWKANKNLIKRGKNDVKPAKQGWKCPLFFYRSV